MRRFLLLAPTFILEPPRPYRRLTPTLLVACREPFWLECGDDSSLSARVALIAPKVPRRRLVAVNSDLAIFDLPIHSRFGEEPVQSLDFERFTSLLPALAEAFAGKLSCAGVDRLFESAVQIISGQAPTPPTLDPRIERALELIDELPFDEVTLTALARRLSLSSSRLRHLFKEVTGNSVSHYTRWAAVWRAVSLWSQGRKLTEIAHQVGFHDLAHLDHAFIDVFGLNPSTVINPENVTLIRCP
ncbi:helix-turn-helix domain-containing protein [Pendulispora albinea]|uniref:AraC family transcriptional regulator n=1 Tax=Pendulispora albinea TaxID=2741071 RepID=A0ABZ2LWB5_9BACT